jgi:hypothetical protein
MCIMCFLHHHWTPWKPRRVDGIVRNLRQTAPVEETFVWQERTCTRCGLIQQVPLQYPATGRQPPPQT